MRFDVRGPIGVTRILNPFDEVAGPASAQVAQYPARRQPKP